jgi:hypothetical protein
MGIFGGAWQGLAATMKNFSSEIKIFQHHLTIKLLNLMDKDCHLTALVDHLSSQELTIMICTIHLPKDLEAISKGVNLFTLKAHSCL